MTVIMGTRPPLPTLSITLTLSSITADERAATVRFMESRVCRGAFAASAAGQATRQIVTAIADDDESIALSLTRPDWGAVFRAVGNAGREGANVAAALLGDLAEQINTADRTANPTLPLLATI